MCWNRRKIVFLSLKTKTIRFVIASFVFFGCFTPVFAQQQFLPVLPRNAVEAERDFNTILLGMRHYNAIVRSGEGECTYSFEQFGIPNVHTTRKAHLTFNQHQTRMDCEESISSDNMHWPQTTFIVTEVGTLQITYSRNGKQSYYFRTEPGLDPLRTWVDPRRWLHVIDTQDLPTYLMERNFRILTVELLNDTPCYVLEAKKEPEPSSNQQANSYERFWVSTEHGMHYLKYENRFLRKNSPDGKIKKGTPSVRRVTLSYELHGEEAWFVKSGVSESFWIDPDGKEHLVSRATIATQNFIVNHGIPAETFTVEIPEDATIHVKALDKKLSKARFLKWYGELRSRPIELIRNH